MATTEFINKALEMFTAITFAYPIIQGKTNDLFSTEIWIIHYLSKRYYSTTQQHCVGNSRRRVQYFFITVCRHTISSTNGVLWYLTERSQLCQTYRQIVVIIIIYLKFVWIGHTIWRHAPVVSHIIYIREHGRSTLTADVVTYI